MDTSVEKFFSKNAADGYAYQYNLDHGPRLDSMIKQWDLRESLAAKRIVDVGGGLGFLGQRMDPTTDYWVIDGADSFEGQRLCNGTWIKRDLDHDPFGAQDLNTMIANGVGGSSFDAAFCLETLEHLTNPYHCLAEIKKLVKPDGDIYISIPHANVTHNYIYPALMVDPNNFAQFLGQMALPIKDYWLWPRGWNAHHFKCRNARWDEKVMLYPKHEEKFRHATPVEMVNW